MAKIENRKKQNPKLRQSELSDGRASLYLEYYLGRTETPVLDKDSNQVFYTEGAIADLSAFFFTANLNEKQKGKIGV